MRLWNNELLSARDGVQPCCVLVLTYPGALRRMFLPPGELTLGEAYLRGDFDVEGDIAAAIAMETRLRYLNPADWLRVLSQLLSLPATNPPQVLRDGRQRGCPTWTGYIMGI